MAHWELGAAATATAMAAWVASPDSPAALVALLAAGGTLGLAVWVRQRRGVVIGSLAFAGALVCGSATLRIRAVERRWPRVREALVDDARRRLDGMLGDAVDLARRAASDAVEVEGLSREAAFARVERALGSGGPEHGVVVFDSTNQPTAWAGHHRLASEPRSDDLYATITPFYAVLTAQRQQGGWRATSEVVLAADSAIPDRENTLAQQFERKTGVALELFMPRSAPAEWTDVFDYCLPSCRSIDVRPDTLFSVRVVPPSQGDRKLQLVGVGRRWVALSALLLLGLVVAVGGLAARTLAVAAVGAFLIFTPAPEDLGLATAFSPATYYGPWLGPLSSSAGALLVTAALATLAALAAWQAAGRRPLWLRGVALGVAAASPYVLSVLATGITPQVDGVPIGIWLLWQSTIATVGGAMLVAAAGALHHGDAGRNLRWTAWTAVAWAGALGIGTLALWSPGSTLPGWLVVWWIPPFVLAVLPAGRVRTLITIAVVAGVAAGTLTWRETIAGRIALADKDAARVGEPVDPITVGLLRRLGLIVEREPVPRTEAALYRLWWQSPLSHDDYPVALATWNGQGALVARLDLAQLDLPAALLEALTRTARQTKRPVIENLARTPGTHYVLLVPFSDGSVVTVGLAPRSRVFAPLRLAQFLRGEQGLAEPYEISLAEPLSVADHATDWHREGWVVRNEQHIEVPGGPRHLHLRVELGSPAQLIVRGILASIVDLVALALLALLALGLTGRARLPAVGLKDVRPRSYRARLTFVLSVFFVTPTMIFAGWGLARLNAEAESGAQLVTRQALRDAAIGVRDLAIPGRSPTSEQLQEVSQRVSLDLLVYDGGVLTTSSPPVLRQLGLVDPYLPPPVFRRLLIEDDLEVAGNAAIGGRMTRVGYRSIASALGRPTVLAAPRLLDDAELFREREDLAMVLALATLLGLGAAAALAALAARALARPVHALRDAAVAVGHGAPLPPLDPKVPTEFVPVVEGLERMARDVRASQSALDKARQRTAAVLRSVATGVIALDAQMQVTMANPRAEELLEAELPSGEPVAGLTGPEWGTLWEWVRVFLEGGDEPEAHELDVGERRFRAQVAGLGGDGGCVVALDDTTDVTRATRVLAWGELARQIAHEIKNPLTPVRLGVQHLERAYRDQRGDFDATLQRTAKQILAEIERLDAIARAFARFGAPPAEAGPLRRENLTDAARETAQLYALGAGVGVEVQGAAGVYARVRRDEFKEVLVNLIENSRTAGASMVTIAIHDRDGGAEVALRDDGRGILPQHLPRIFEPQFSTTTSGTGLGLAICKRLVESWGGTLTVASEPGLGTTVTILATG